MIDILKIVNNIFLKNSLIVAFLTVGIITFFSYALSKHIFKNKIHGSSIAIITGLVIAYVGGLLSGGNKGIADVPTLAGIGVLGGAMMRDFTIVSTAFGADLNELKKCGAAGIISLILGILISFIVGVILAMFAGFTSPKDLATIASGAVTFVVGPVTGAALGVDSSVIALSIAIGVVKSISIMVITPPITKFIKINTPQQALIFGGLLGSTSGTSAAMAAINPDLVPYAAMTATFYTGLGCLICPSILYIALDIII